jgi:hypothetical protein
VKERMGVWQKDVGEEIFRRGRGRGRGGGKREKGEEKWKVNKHVSEGDLCSYTCLL